MRTRSLAVPAALALAFLAAAASPAAAQWPYQPIVEREFQEEAGDVCSYAYHEQGWTVRSGSAGQACFTTTLRDLLDSVQIEATAQALEGPEVSSFGMMFGYRRIEGTDQDRYFLFRIGTAGDYTLEAWNRDEWLTLIPFTPHQAVQTGPRAVNRLAVRVDGSVAVLIANGVELTRYDTGREIVGAAGVYTNGAYPEDEVPAMNVLFTDFRMTPLSPPAAAR
ncbi:MAG TPA: hypothetical protein VFQ45_07710 [Longimicrobium sp.]|nr:hypothetical protein [Longimicrobium sp.]